jgi:hypothetical protein
MKIQITFLLAIGLLIGLSSCKKYNQVDNASTVKTPYTLFIGGYNGTLHKTNDGLYYKPLFPTDNRAVRQIVVADSNLLYLKENFYYSTNEGSAFQISNNHVNPYFDVFYKYYLPNQAIYDKTTKRVYLCTKSTGNGLEYSTDYGVTFTQDANWNDPTLDSLSITQLDNGDLYILKDSASNVYRRTGTSNWTRVIPDLVNVLPSDSFQAPQYITKWYISHTHDTLIAIDYDGINGVYYSADYGVNWFPCTGIPKVRKILFGHQAFGNNTFYVGIDSGGLYKLKGSVLEPTSAGIPWYAKVHYVEGKTLTYRTDVKRTYLFCATDLGLYRSETNGLDWKLIRTGTYSTLY